SKYVLDLNPLLHLPLQETSGTLFRDQSGSEMHATGVYSSTGDWDPNGAAANIGAYNQPSIRYGSLRSVRPADTNGNRRHIQVRHTTHNGRLNRLFTAGKSATLVFWFTENSLLTNWRMLCSLGDSASGNSFE